MLRSKPFQFTIWLLLIFLTIWVGSQISFVFYPLVVLITAISLPVLGAGLLYYLINPAVDRLAQGRLPRTVIILLLYLAAAGLLVFTFVFLGPILQRQFLGLIDSAPEFLAYLHSEFLRLEESAFFERFQEVEFFEAWRNIDYAEVVDNLVEAFMVNISTVLGYITNFFVVLFTIPFILFYMLKDGHRFPSAAAKILPGKYQKKGESILREMSDTLSSYVQGQLIVSLFVGTFVYIGYLIVGLDYAFLLALFAAITNVIPYFGPFIGTIPGLFVALLESPWTALQVVIIIGVVQQLESQLISPQVLGRKMALHPVLIIFILLTAGSLAGFVGLILAVPTFAVARVIVIHLYRFMAAKKQEESTASDN